VNESNYLAAFSFLATAFSFLSTFFSLVATFFSVLALLLSSCFTVDAKDTLVNNTREARITLNYFMAFNFKGY
jgi:hypothetical protein